MRSTFQLMDLSCLQTQRSVPASNQMFLQGSRCRRSGNDAKTLDDLLMSLRDDFQGSSYDEIGAGYTATRRTDPRIAAQIHRALGDARSVANVSAGAGAYEPYDRRVLPIESSQRMIAQRGPGLAP